MIASQPTTEVAPGRAFSLTLLGVLVVAALIALAVASDERARREAYLHSPIRADIRHCAERHGSVVRDPSGKPYCRILVL